MTAAVRPRNNRLAAFRDSAGIGWLQGEVPDEPTRLIDGDDRDELPGAIQVNDTIWVIKISKAIGISVRLVNTAGDADRVFRLKAPNHINLFRGHRHILRQWLQAGHLF